MKKMFLFIMALAILLSACFTIGPVACYDNQVCTDAERDLGGCNDCVTNTCTDDIKNGLETDIDCGGSSCSECSEGRMCVINTDCSSGLCQSGLCESSDENAAYVYTQSEGPLDITLNGVTFTVSGLVLDDDYVDSLTIDGVAYDNDELLGGIEKEGVLLEFKDDFVSQKLRIGEIGILLYVTTGDSFNLETYFLSLNKTVVIAVGDTAYNFEIIGGNDNSDLGGSIVLAIDGDPITLRAGSILDIGEEKQLYVPDLFVETIPYSQVSAQLMFVEVENAQDLVKEYPNRTSLVYLELNTPQTVSVGNNDHDLEVIGAHATFETIGISEDGVTKRLYLGEETVIGRVSVNLIETFITTIPNLDVSAYVELRDDSSSDPSFIYLTLNETQSLTVTGTTYDVTILGGNDEGSFILLEIFNTRTNERSQVRLGRRDQIALGDKYFVVDDVLAFNIPKLDVSANVYLSDEPQPGEITPVREVDEQSHFKLDESKDVSFNGKTYDVSIIGGNDDSNGGKGAITISVNGVRDSLEEGEVDSVNGLSLFASHVWVQNIPALNANANLHVGLAEFGFDNEGDILKFEIESLLTYDDVEFYFEYDTTSGTIVEMGRVSGSNILYDNNSLQIWYEIDNTDLTFFINSSSSYEKVTYGYNTVYDEFYVVEQSDFDLGSVYFNDEGSSHLSFVYVEFNPDAHCEGTMGGYNFKLEPCSGRYDFGQEDFSVNIVSDNPSYGFSVYGYGNGFNDAIVGTSSGGASYNKSFGASFSYDNRLFVDDTPYNGYLQLSVWEGSQGTGDELDLRYGIVLK